MGKVDLAFDHIKDNKEIQELSVVLYADSFFYGLWGSDNLLLKSGYHPLESIEASSQIWSYYYDFTKIKVLSSVKPFVHIANEDVDQNYFDLYFQGLYNLNRLEDSDRIRDRFQAYDLSTLHYVEKAPLDFLKAQNLGFELSHISTAMSKYASATSSEWICYVANNILHVCFHNENGFRLYNQFDCYYEQDYLYYLSLISKHFELDRGKVSLKIGGEITKGTHIKKLIRRYFGNISFIGSEINFLKKVAAKSLNYYDLYLCKTCA